MKRSLLNVVVPIVLALGVFFLPVDTSSGAESNKKVLAAKDAPKKGVAKGKQKTSTAKKKTVAKAGQVSKRSVAASGKAKRQKRTAATNARSGPGAEQKLSVQSGFAFVFDQGAGEALYQKNAGAVVPIASITKLMTAMVVLDSAPNLQAPITISENDVDYLRGSRSRLPVGTVIGRETALLLALMSSENRAAHALARHYPGGLPAFLGAMNAKARELGMRDTHFEDPTGLTKNNVSTARDLARMVAAAQRYPLIREFSTTPEAFVEVSGRQMAYRNTNPLVKSAAWDVGVSKTGYIQEAGKCLVMQARVAEKPVVIVLLDSAGKETRVGDANRIRRWMEHAFAARKAATHAQIRRGEGV
ncbi:D-alanyl-D-alanine endopeptidase [Propionivibrio limicola]|uniref:D-alanyl-D-alanine endopeptidase n=1 Tax=Propionivibrio limicola TaxID=167645 RepID=UPI001291DE42|nr:D-alanyl-D-alanine endopeptidase [Propionivibrio limicola]